ncbi:MAG: type II toxin-antitoxin system VapC family toxin [Methyloglobulus sp.]|nr:type II toxin-antitoxin system VapC family toxin [Methyloglobulus sp.]
MLILLDTHVLIWLDQDDPALGSEARKRADLALQQGKLAVSAITFWETAMLVAKGRVTMTLPIAAWRRDLLSLGLVEIPVDGDIGIAAAQLDLHGDPADRIIVATAQIRGATLLTADHPLLQWDNSLERFDARR